MLDDGLLRRFNCLAMVSKDYKSESRTVSRLECCQHCTKEFQLIFKPKKKIKERKQTNILFLHWFQNTGIPVLRFLLRLIHHWLLVHVCIYVNGFITYRTWSFIWDCTHILHYIANHSRKVFIYVKYVQYVLFIFYKFMYSFVQKSVPLFSAYMYKYWIHEACMCKCL